MVQRAGRAGRGTEGGRGGGGRRRCPRRPSGAFSSSSSSAAAAASLLRRGVGGGRARSAVSVGGQRCPGRGRASGRSGPGFTSRGGGVGGQRRLLPCPPPQPQARGVAAAPQGGEGGPWCRSFPCPGEGLPRAPGSGDSGRWAEGLPGQSRSPPRQGRVGRGWERSRLRGEVIGVPAALSPARGCGRPPACPPPARPVPPDVSGGGAGRSAK